MDATYTTAQLDAARRMLEANHGDTAALAQDFQDLDVPPALAGAVVAALEAERFADAPACPDDATGCGAAAGQVCEPGCPSHAV